jgi:hypothetical protein
VLGIAEEMDFLAAEPQLLAIFQDDDIFAAAKILPSLYEVHVYQIGAVKPLKRTGKHLLKTLQSFVMQLVRSIAAMDFRVIIGAFDIQNLRNRNHFDATGILDREILCLLRSLRQVEPVKRLFEPFFCKRFGDEIQDSILKSADCLVRVRGTITV